MALGGVAIGIIKAKLAASVAGMISKCGCIPRPMAIPASKGIKVAVVAVFEVSSVRNTTPLQIIIRITTSGNSGKRLAWALIKLATPFCCMALASEGHLQIR